MNEPGSNDLAPRRDDSRRGFIRGSSLLLAGALPSAAIASVGGPSLETASKRDPLRVGLVGCGYQGVQIASQLLATSNDDSVPLRLSALADAFPERLQQALRALRGRFGDRVTIPGSARFVGMRAYQDLFETDVDLVLLATPLPFRQGHLEAAMAAGKHVFAEAPIAHDVSGAQRLGSAMQWGLRQRLGLAVDLPHRYDPRLQATVEYLQRGAIGRIVMVRAEHPSRFRNHATAPTPAPEVRAQRRSGSPGDYELLERRACGLDLVNWLLAEHPAEAASIRGGASQLVSAIDGHEAAESQPIEFTYASGVSLLSLQIPGNRRRGKCASISVQGTSGWCNLDTGEVFDSRNRLVWKAAEQAADKVQERPRDSIGSGQSLLSGSNGSDVGHAKGGNRWDQFLGAIATGQVFHQATLATECTLTAILGKVACSGTGRVTWDQCFEQAEGLDCIAAVPN